MSAEELIEAIKAADLGGFREVRLTMLVHQQGPTKAVVDQVLKEFDEVSAAERAEAARLGEYLTVLDKYQQTLNEAGELAQKAKALKQKATPAAST